MEVSQYILSKENVEPQTGDLAESIFGDAKQGKVLAFKSKAPAPREGSQSSHRVLYSSNSKTETAVKPTRFISQTPLRVLDAPGVTDDYYTNPIDWGCNNSVAIALGSTVYLWNASTASTVEFNTFNQLITSVHWHQDAQYLGIGLSDGTVQMWDAERQKALRCLKGHNSRVGVMSSFGHMLSTGSKDTMINTHDVRIQSSLISQLNGHSEEVCGLKWNADGTQLASGGNDNTVNIWNAGASTPKFTFTDHTAGVKALSWAPFQKDLLATGGGATDRSIKFWNTTTGALLNTIDANSQVSSLIWSKDPSCKEIVSSHGISQNEINVWKYPTLVKTAELRGHRSRILSMAQSPDGSSIASISGDESVRFWKVFDVPNKSVSKKVDAPLNSTVRHIR